MAITIQHRQACVGTAGEGAPGAVSGGDGQPTAARLTTEQVWHQVAKASFAVLGAIVHPAGSPQARPLLKELGSLIPAERQASGSVIEVIPQGEFLTYALGIPLSKMRDPAAAWARVPVTHQASTP